MQESDNDRRAVVDGWMGTDQAAAYLGKSAAWLRNYARQYGIPRVRLGQQWRYKAADLDLWLKAGRGAA